MNGDDKGALRARARQYRRLAHYATDLNSYKVLNRLADDTEAAAAAAERDDVAERVDATQSARGT